MCKRINRGGDKKEKEKEKKVKSQNIGVKQRKWCIKPLQHFRLVPKTKETQQHAMQGHWNI